MPPGQSPRPEGRPLPISSAERFSNEKDSLRTIPYDVWRDHNQQITLILTILRLTKQRTEDGEIHKERNTCAHLRFFDDRQSADYCSFAVIDEHLRVSLLCFERKAE